MKLTLIVWVVAFWCLPTWGQRKGLNDATQFGPAAGALAAEFSLVDQFGQRRNLESLMGPQGLTLVFFRSADW